MQMKLSRKAVLLSACALLAAVCLGAARFAGVGAGSGQKLSVVCTIFPIYDWTREILGARASETELTLLLSNGTDLHNYQPSTNDFVKISRCGLFAFVGGKSDAWTQDALREAVNKKIAAIDLMKVLGPRMKREEAVEGMEEDHDEGGPSYDEHVWLSLRNAKAACAAIAEKLCEIDPQHADEYKKNEAAYAARLDALDKEYGQVVAAAKNKTLLFGDRFPFRYLADDYGLKYSAAFPGCSAETEASFRTVIFLAKKAGELRLRHVLVIDGSNRTVAQAIIQAAPRRDLDILTLDSMQSVTAKQIEAGTTYLSVMRANLDALREALN